MTKSVMNKKRGAGALVMAGLLLSGGTAMAQSASSHAASDQAPPGAQAVDDHSDTRAPVLRVTSVEVIRSTHGSTLDIIRVRGLASSQGWEEGELVPLTKGVPADGILELVFVARAPAEAMEATGFELMEAIFPLEPNHPYKGINVHSASESITLTQFPGYAEGKAAGEDCSKCVGKYFVAKGAAMPTGKAASEVVKEEQLPASTHVIKSTDGISKPVSDPNHLTLVLNKDGRITTAIWD